MRARRIPVWVIAFYDREGVDDAWLLDAYPALTSDDLAAARAYAGAHPEEVQQDLLENARP